MRCLLYLAPLSACQDRIKKASGGGLALWNHVPYCRPDGGFQDVQCNAQNGNCWCVNLNGLEYTETQSKKIPNCALTGMPLVAMVFLEKTCRFLRYLDLGSQIKLDEEELHFQKKE